MKTLRKLPPAHANNKAGRGIRTRLVLGLTLFVIIVLIIVWIFQVFLLDFFYERSKLSELGKVHKGIDEAISSGNLDDVCGELAAEYDVCVVVYKISNNELIEPVISKDVSPTCIIHYADKSYLQTLYNQAKESGGTFTQRIDLDPRELKRGNTENKYDYDYRYNKNHYDFKGNDKLTIAVSVKIFEDGIGDEHVAFINLKFTPVNTIQNTRNTQFAYIALVVVIASVAFALVFSSGVARPLEKMTISAERMARGDYSAKFAVEGYNETKRLAQTLNYAVEEISKTDKLQRELIANVSHDLRTPLTLISGYAEMMRDIPGENTPENSQLIVDETHRLTSLVNDILDFSKYSSGTQKADFVTFNLTENVRHAINRYSELIKRDGYTIEFISDKDVDVHADSKMILQVLYNLISNAINYTGEDKKVIINQNIISETTVKISISDSGEGIHQNDIDHIWDRYYKVDKNHSRAVAGSGLGLSIVSKLLQLHSSSYGVESSSTKGTTFWFTLKVVKE